MLGRFAILILLSLLVIGCQADPRATAPSLDQGPLATTDGRARSLAMDSPAGHETAAGRPMIDEPWYASRNDARDAVTVGVRQPAYLYSATRTVDRQVVSGGRVHTHFTQTQHRGVIIHGVR